MARKFLIIDVSVKHRQVVQTFLKRIFPDGKLDEYDPLQSGRPKDDFSWDAYDILIMDARLGQESGLDWLKTFRSCPGFPPVIYLSSDNSVDVAVQAMKLGASDYLLKRGLNAERFQAAIEEAVNDQPLHDLLPEINVAPMMDLLPDVRSATETQQEKQADYDGAATQVLPKTIMAAARQQAKSTTVASSAANYEFEPTEKLSSEDVAELMGEQSLGKEAGSNNNNDVDDITATQVIPSLNADHGLELARRQFGKAKKNSSDDTFVKTAQDLDKVLDEDEFEQTQILPRPPM